MSTLINTSGLATADISDQDELFREYDATSKIHDINSKGTWVDHVGTALGTWNVQEATTNGSPYAFELSEAGITNNAGVQFDLNAILTGGVDYVITVDAKHDGTASTQWKGTLQKNEFSTYATIFSINAGAGETWTTYTLSFTHDSTDGRYLVFKEANGTQTGGIFVDNISLKPA